MHRASSPAPRTTTCVQLRLTLSSHRSTIQVRKAMRARRAADTEAEATAIASSPATNLSITPRPCPFIPNFSTASARVADAMTAVTCTASLPPESTAADMRTQRAWGRSDASISAADAVWRRWRDSVRGRWESWGSGARGLPGSSFFNRWSSVQILCDYCAGTPFTASASLKRRASAFSQSYHS
jgi:hypothetical protein